MRSFKVRPAAIEDLDDCIWFDRQESLEPARDDRHRLMVESRIFTGDILLACDDDNKPIGYLRIDHLWPMMMPTLGWVYVKPDWRESGVMAGLYQSILDLLLERGHRKFMMSTQSTRSNVMELFRSMGMRECGRLNVHGEGNTISEVFYLCEI